MAAKKAGDRSEPEWCLLLDKPAERYELDYDNVPEAIGGLGDYFRFLILSDHISHWDIEHHSRCSLRSNKIQRREGSSFTP